VKERAENIYKRQSSPKLGLPAAEAASGQAFSGTPQGPWALPRMA